MLEWVYGSIVSTAEKARDGAKRCLGMMPPTAAEAHLVLVRWVRVYGDGGGCRVSGVAAVRQSEGTAVVKGAGCQSGGSGCWVTVVGAGRGNGCKIRIIGVEEGTVWVGPVWKRGKGGSGC